MRQSQRNVSDGDIRGWSQIHGKQAECCDNFQGPRGFTVRGCKLRSATKGRACVASSVCRSISTERTFVTVIERGTRSCAGAGGDTQA